jgi:predicted DNA-binding transcriptional regulator AlpA
MDQETKPMRFLGVGDLMARWGVCRMTIERLVRSDPDFPRSIRIGRKSRIRKWAEAAIEKYERASVVKGGA